MSPTATALAATSAALTRGTEMFSRIEIEWRGGTLGRRDSSSAGSVPKPTAPAFPRKALNRGGPVLEPFSQVSVFLDKCKGICS